MQAHQYTEHTYQHKGGATRKPASINVADQLQARAQGAWGMSTHSSMSIKQCLCVRADPAKKLQEAAA